jgi:superfamily II DNA helicase RecQ
VFALLPTGFGKSLIYQVLPALFSELHRLLRGAIENFVVAVVSPLEYICVQRQVETDLEKAWARAFKPCTELTN